MRKAGTPRQPTGGLSPEIQRKVDTVKREFDRLQKAAELTTVTEAVARIGERLAESPAELRALQRRGFVHSRRIQERLEAQQKQWRASSPELRTALKQQESRLRASARSTGSLVAQASGGRPTSLDRAENAVDKLKDQVNTAERELRAFYGNIDSELHAVQTELQRIDWMLDGLESSTEVRLRNAEGPLRAVKAEWHQDGDDGPKGILFLTDQRLLFEQREEVVTKKRFGVFKAESEMVQKLRLTIEMPDIDSVEASEEGGFLGVGKDDILELTCKGSAPVSRARFHLDGQDSAGWRALIERIHTGDIENERHATAQQGLAAAARTFPTNCPNCLATLPAPHPGATRLTCEFCNTVVGPIEAE